MTATEFKPALGTERTMGGAACGDELRGTTTGVARTRLISLAERTTQGRRFLISEPTVGSRLIHQISPRSIFIAVESFPILHILGNRGQLVGFVSGFFQSAAFALKFARDKFGNKLGSFATGNVRAKLLYQRRREFKGNFHRRQYTIRNTSTKEFLPHQLKFLCCLSGRETQQRRYNSSKSRLHVLQILERRETELPHLPHRYGLNVLRITKEIALTDINITTTKPWMA
jgi:hypothetical protein